MAPKLAECRAAVRRPWTSLGKAVQHRKIHCVLSQCAGGGGRKAGNGLILVFDFGGGTLDVSMLGLSDGVFVTLAIAGTIHFILPVIH